MDTIATAPLVPLRAAGGSWKYDFACMDIGDVMHCPIMEGETPRKAQMRVMSAARSWYTRGGYQGYKFTSEQRTQYIKIERINP